jgi:iron complex outermembrane receptor protein
LALLGAGAVAWVPAAAAERSHDIASTGALKQLSLDELMNTEVTSVSKKAEPLSEAAAAIYVITHEDIARSGATSIPELLRLAPNLQVAQTSATGYVITARGFSGNVENQNLPNKLLVLIDGRSVYTPLYSGVYWDMQEVMTEDIERIEVISGPGATLWGANAMNGVINIITRPSTDTQGGVMRLGGGNLERSASARYGGRLNGATTFRVYAEGFDRDALEQSSGVSAGDRWTRSQGGFRLDWAESDDSLTFQGDIYRVSEDQLGGVDQSIAGHNLLSRWQHQLTSGSQLELQAYYDETERMADDDGSGFVFQTYDFELQHSFALGDRNDLVWGAGTRLNRYRITNTDVFLFSPPRRTLHLGNLFAQDSITLASTLKLILGVKIEDDAYSSHLTPLPSARLSWEVSAKTLLWSSVSRAVRSPTPFDRDVVEKIGSQPFLTGGPQFTSEKVVAYQIGYRGQPTAQTSLSISSFYHVYDDLRSIEFTPQTFLPLVWGNGMKGETYGVEVWGSQQVNDWWRLSAGFNTLHENLRFKRGSSGSLGLAGFPGVAQAGSDPRHQASLRSSMNLMENVTFDADLRHVGARPDPVTPQYYELNARLAWTPTKPLDISLTGFNLLHARHIEYFGSPTSAEMMRSVFVEARWRF